MITLNGNRTKPTSDDVLSELDAFEAETMTTAKKFTAFILDVNRQPEDPRIVHFETTSGATMHGDIETAYFYECDAGKDDPEFETSGGADAIGDLWQHKGAAVLGVIAGHHDVAWNIDGMANADYDAAFNLAKKAEEKAAAADPFKENYRSAWVSTAHLMPATLTGLNAVTSNRALPFWIHATVYGWIIRFDALDVYGSMEGEGYAAHELSVRPDLMAIKELLYKHGYQAAHLDADGPEIEGLASYEHC